jgi:integrase
MRHKYPLHHPLESCFEHATASLTTSLGDGSVRGYQVTFRSFLRYLAAHHPKIRRLRQLRRDPHVLGWLAELRSHEPRLAKSTIAIRAVYLHRLLGELAWTKQIPSLMRLLSREDVPRRDQILPRALLPEQDQLLQQELRRRDDLLSNLLLLQRHTGMRIGECVDLAADCLRPLGPDQWAIHVPVGKFNKDRLVPVDSFVCHIVERLQSLRSQGDQPPGAFLLPRHRSRQTLIRRVRAAFRAAATAAGITARLVPHQARHTYASEMLRAGVSLLGVMKLLGHSRPEMTMQYLKITLQDLQHEYRKALANSPHLVPSPRALSASSSRADLPSLLLSLDTAAHILEMFRRALPDGSERRLLGRIRDRIGKIIAQLRPLNPPPK